MKKQKSFLFIAMLSLMTIAACGKNDQNQVAVAPVAAPVPQATGSYYVSGTQCLQTGTNIVIGPAPCPVQTGYPQIGYPQPGYPVSLPPGFNQYPAGYTPGVGGYVGINVGIGSINVGGVIGVGGQDMTCRGWWFQPGVGWGWCNGLNCHGMVMINQYGPAWCP